MIVHCEFLLLLRPEQIHKSVMIEKLQQLPSHVNYGLGLKHER